MAHSLFDSLSGNMSNIENQSAIQSILDTHNVTETNTAQVEDEDVFQCGKCKKQFSNLSLFVGHKQTRCTPIAPRPTLQNTAVIQGLGNSAFTATAPQHGIRTQLPQNSAAGFSTVNQTPLNQLTNSMVLTDDQMLTFSDITQTVQNGIIQGSTLHLGPGNTVQTNGSFLSPVTQLAPRATNNVTILSAIQPTTSLSASNGSAFTSTASVNNLQPLVPQQQLQPVFSITALPEKPQNMHIIKPSPTKAARKSAQASALNGGETDHSGYTDDGKKKLVCTYCGKVFMKNFDLQQHIRSHTGEKPFQCVVCGRAFAQKSNVKKHMSTHKVWPSGPSGSTLPVQPPAMLVPVEDETEKSSPAETSDTPEQQTENDVEPESPEGRQADKEKKLLKKEQYKLKVVIDNSYMCQYCPEKFKSYYQLKSHMVKHKSFQVYKCVVTECGQTFQDMETFLDHTSTHNEDITYRCHQCSKVFSTLYELGIHQYSHSLYQNPGKSGPWHFQCTMCMSKYATPEALQHHMSTTSHEYPCPHCQKNFTCERFLRKHLASHGTENQYECSVCQKNLKTEHYLKNHMLIHTGEKPYECETCGAAFNRKDKLKRHNLIHDAKVKYKCPFKAVCGCTKEFCRPDKLKAHLITHSSVKPYSCDICGKDFARKPHYNEHMRGHRNDYPYNCEKCKRGFFRPKLFKEHKCEDANGQLKKKRLFQPRRVKRKPGRPRKVMKTDNRDNKGSKSIYLEHGKGTFLIEKLEIVPKDKEKQELSDKETVSQSEIETENDNGENSNNASEEPIETLEETQENVANVEKEQENEDENRTTDGSDTVAVEESENMNVSKKPKPECYVKISPTLVPVSMVERYVTVQLTTTNGGDGGEIQTQLIPASEIGGQIQFATPVPGLQISPSSSATTFHPIQIIEGQPMTLTVSQGDHLGDIGVGESNVIDIPVDIVTVSNDEAMLCTQEVTNDGDASEQTYGTLVNYAPDHLINSSVEILGPENM
ncbi:zinc finger protein 341-like isoform X2 [Mercenaria mercenaria]|uniref:zinc finger protein 341-like isoform X2 n=1 Tax=Mercenaria mercenaria TaxID=6596 RepID=UPI00234ECA79|nr:zinc finger protein 341-like isoform X2 [Mercenaria mercenaria]